MTPETNFQNPSTPQLDPDLLNAAYSPSIRKTVRGGDKLQGVKPELLDHWNSLQDEFSRAGLVPEIKSGFRTAVQQNALFRNPATAAKTKGHDGYISISPHQRGEALDISFPANQRAKGRSILAEYAKRNGLSIPSDEPWHLGLSSQAKPALDPDLLSAGYGQQQPSTPTTQAVPQLDPDLMKAAFGNVEQPKTEKITSEAKPVEFQGATPQEVEQAAPEPIKFQPADNSKLNKLARSVQGLSDRVAMQGIELPKNHPDFVGQHIDAKFDHQPTLEEVDDALMENLGKGYGGVAKKFREETGTILSANAAVEKQPDGSYLVHARPTQGFIEAINAYAQGGRAAYEDAISRQTLGKAALARDVNAELKKGQGVRQDLAQAGAREVAKTAQFMQNASDVLRGIAPEDDPNAKAIDRAAQSIPQPTTWTGSAGETGLGTLGVMNRAEALGGGAGFPAAQAVEAAQRGPEAAYKAGVLAAPIVAMGPIGKAVGADELSAAQRQVLLRGVGAEGLAASTVAGGGSPRDIATSALTGGAFPVGAKEGREGANETQTQPNVTPQPESPQPADVLGGGVNPVATGSGNATASVSDRAIPEGQATEPVRHVDLQSRVKRGDGKGQFKEETTAQAEARRAQVNPEQPNTDVTQTAGDLGDGRWLTTADAERIRKAAHEAIEKAMPAEKFRNQGIHDRLDDYVDMALNRARQPNADAIPNTAEQLSAKLADSLSRDLGTQVAPMAVVPQTPKVYDRILSTDEPAKELTVKNSKGKDVVLSPDAAWLYDLGKDGDPVSLDLITSEPFNWPHARATRALLNLEMNDSAQQLPGRSFRVTATPAEASQVTSPLVSEGANPKVTGEIVTSLPEGFKRAQPSKPEGVRWLLYRNEKGEVIGRGALEGDQIVGLEVLPEARQKGNGSAILDDLIKRGGREAVAGSAEARDLYRKRGQETKSNRFTFDESLSPTQGEAKVEPTPRQKRDALVAESDRLYTEANQTQDSAKMAESHRLAQEAGEIRKTLPKAEQEQIKSEAVGSMIKGAFGAGRKVSEPQPIETKPNESRASETAPELKPATTGIAQRVEEARRQGEASRGEGITAQDSVERGRQLLSEGKSPEQTAEDFRRTGAISSDAMALMRAKHEELARAANRAFDEGRQNLNNPKFKEAEQARQDFWEKSVKPMQTVWSDTGRAQQGETDIDTGTFYGLYRAFKDSHSREPSSKEQGVLKDLSAKSAKAEADVQNVTGRLAAELDKAAGIQDLPPEIQQAIKRFINQSARESRRGGRQQTRKALDEEAATIKTNLAAAFQKVKSPTGIQPSGLARLDPEGEITKQLIAYAKNRAKAGITDAAQLIDDVHSAVKDFADVTKREVAEAILGAGLPKTERSQSEWATIKSGVRDEVKDYTTQEARGALGTRLQGVKKIPPEDASEVWKYARENYIDKGNNDFADVTQKVASDLGITPDQVRRSLANSAATKRASDEMWKKMSDRRQAKQNAESWLRQADSSSAAKAFENARRLFFITKTAGHGAVAPFTHAPANVFIPSRWAQFWPNFGRTYKFMLDKGAHEQAVTDLERSPNYITAKRAGLANDPKKGYDEYQSPWMAKTLGKLGISGNRAFDSLKTMRQDLFDSAWHRISEADRTPEMAKIISEEINSSTGASKALTGRDWPSRFLGKAMFAAPLEASRWEFLVRDNARALQSFTNWKNATPESRYMAKRVASRNAQLVATYGALLAMNQGLLSATGSKDKINFTDPTKADFLAFKMAGRTISPASGMLTAIRFIGTLASQAKNADLKKPAQTVEDMAKTTFKYGRSKLSPLFGTGTDVALRSDYGGRPLPFSQQEGTDERPRYTWLEYLLSQQTPIPIGEGVRDVYHTMREQGMAEGQTKSLLKALAKAVPVSAVAATGIRMGETYSPNPEQERKAGVQSFKDRFMKGAITENDLDRAAKKSELTQSDISSILKEKDLASEYNPSQLAFYKSPTLTRDKKSTSLERYERMTQRMQMEVKDIMQEKADAILDSDALTEDQKKNFAKRIKDVGLAVRGWKEE